MGPKGPAGIKGEPGAKGEPTFCLNCCKRWYFTFNGMECKGPLAIDGLHHIHVHHGKTDYNVHKVTHIAGYCQGIPRGTSQKYVVSSLLDGQSKDNKPYTSSSSSASPRVWSDTQKIYTAGCCIPGAIATALKGSSEPLIIVYKNSDNSTTYLSDWSGEILDRICSRLRVIEKLKFANDAKEFAKLTVSRNTVLKQFYFTLSFAMVVKRCPNCDQTLPVACKSCPCGHIFISRKLHQAQVKKEGENVNVLERDKRLRPERPKKENPDFDYEFPENLVWVNKDQMPFPLTQKDTVRIEKLQEKQISQISQLPQTIDGVVLPKKRGRPKGSKNKVKTDSVTGEVIHPQPQPVQLDEDGMPIKRKRGRPKGSKNKPKPQSLLSPNKSVKNGNDDGEDQTSSGSDNKEPVDVMPQISREKAEMYSLILSDINQKMMSQSCMKYV
ncbi:unnamed protein product [Pocillopora meandrina]|uniref:Uncharacterized protein n=1 Tax=Pocillopora meandrina TaxID=46732 RepID=A0AAU9VXC6_9CNID|nr:unnamed protein product [Pocillopora meandrina]